MHELLDRLPDCYGVIRLLNLLVKPFSAGSARILVSDIEHMINFRQTAQVFRRPSVPTWDKVIRFSPNRSIARTFTARPTPLPSITLLSPLPTPPSLKGDDGSRSGGRRGIVDVKNSALGKPPVFGAGRGSGVPPVVIRCSSSARYTCIDNRGFLVCYCLWH